MYQIYKADTGISTCCLLIAIVFSVLLIWCCWFGSLPCKQEVFGWKLQKSIFFKITSSTAVFLLLFFFFLSYALLPRKFEGKGNLLYLKSSSYSGKHFPPEGLNHVHSSHLFSFTQRIMASGGQKKQWEQMESQETKKPFSCKSISKRGKRKHIQCKQFFSETLWSRSQRHKSQKFQHRVSTATLNLTVLDFSWHC